MDFISRYRYFKVWAYMPPPGQNTTPDPGFFSVKEYIQQIVYESSTTDSNIQPVPIYFANLKKLQKFN